MMSDTKGPRFRNRSRHHPLGFFAEAQDPRAIVEVNTTAAKVRRSITEDEQLLIGTCSMTLRATHCGIDTSTRLVQENQGEETPPH